MCHGFSKTRLCYKGVAVELLAVAVITAKAEMSHIVPLHPMQDLRYNNCFIWHSLRHFLELTSVIFSTKQFCMHLLVRVLYI